MAARARSGAGQPGIAFRQSHLRLPCQPAGTLPNAPLPLAQNRSHRGLAPITPGAPPRMRQRSAFADTPETAHSYMDLILKAGAQVGEHRRTIRADEELPSIGVSAEGCMSVPLFKSNGFIGTNSCRVTDPDPHCRVRIISRLIDTREVMHRLSHEAGVGTKRSWKRGRLGRLCTTRTWAICSYWRAS